MRCLVLIGFVLAGCAEFPEVDAASRNLEGPAPPLLPMDDLLVAPAPTADERGTALSEQASALRGQAGI